MTFNPIPKLREAWHEVKREFSDVPHHEKPRRVRLAHESAEALDKLKKSVDAVKTERKRLRERAH